MSEQKFYLELTGHPVEGREHDEVAVALAHLLRTTAVHGRDLLRGERSRIKRELDEEKAIQLKEKLIACGAQCEITPAERSDDARHLLDAVFEKPVEPESEPQPQPQPEMNQPKLNMSSSEEKKQPNPDPSLAQFESESAPTSSQESDEQIESPETAAQSDSQETLLITPISPHRQQATAEIAKPAVVAESVVIAGRQKIVSILAGVAILLGVALWAGLSFLGESESTPTPPVAKESARESSAPAVRPKVVTEADKTEQRIEMLARSVRIWMIQYGAGFDPSQVTMERMQQDLAISPEQMQDSWGVALRYTPEEAFYTISSAGPDQVFGNEDDINVRKEAR